MLGSEVKLLRCVWLFAIPWTVAYQAPPFIEFSRQEYWSGLPFPSPGDLPNPGIKPRSSTLQADCLPSELPEKPLVRIKNARPIFFLSLQFSTQWYVYLYIFKEKKIPKKTKNCKTKQQTNKTKTNQTNKQKNQIMFYGHNGIKCK